MDDMRAGIENTLYRYAWAYDMGEIASIGDCFTIGAEIEFRDTGWKSGREAVVAELRRRRERHTDGSVPWHVISNVYITEGSENQPVVRSWFTAFLHEADGTQKFVAVGWYDDVFSLEDGIWRIMRRRTLMPSDG
jgi:hypothetical protein